MGDAKFEGRMPSLRIRVDHFVIAGRMPLVAGRSCPVPIATVHRHSPVYPFDVQTFLASFLASSDGSMSPRMLEGIRNCY